MLTPTAALLAETSAADPRRSSGRWALIALVVAVQVLILVGGIAVFSALGAQDVGSCGGG